MSQKLKCPVCGAEVYLEQMTQAADLLALAKAQAAFGDDWPLVAEYLDGFRPLSGKPLAVKKLLRLAREVWAMWSQGRFKFGREEYMVGQPEFREAMAGVANRDMTGLTGHNYLKKALMGAAEKTSQRLERDLKEKEGRLRVKSRGSDSSQVSPEQDETDNFPDDLEWRKEYLRLLKRSTARFVSGEERTRRLAELQAHKEKDYGQKASGE